MGPDSVAFVSGGFADRLKAATADQHAAAENHVFQRALVRGEVSRTGLAAYQAALFELIRVIEARLRAREPHWGPLAEAMGAHADRLALDLAGLRNGAPASSGSDAVRAFSERLGGNAWSAEATLGAFYVIEGSMNGNRYIRRAVEEKRPDLAACLRYFDPYGQDQRARWKEFRRAIDDIGGTLNRPGEAVRAARETFSLASELGDEVQAAEAVAA